MADSWELITPYGKLELNPTFSTPFLAAGGVSGPGALRRDDRGTYQRSGDGLRTPGPLILTGRVWRDDQDAALIIEELNDIRAAVLDCTRVIRSTTAGTYTFTGLEGGPSPEVTPDGLGGWEVKIDLWPAKPNPAFRSAALGNLKVWIGVAPEFLDGALRDIVSRHEFPQYTLGVAAEFSGGAMEEPVVKLELPPFGANLAAEFTGGLLRDVVTKSELDQLSATLAPEFVEGDLADIGKRINLKPAVQLTTEFIGGEYKP